MGASSAQKSLFSSSLPTRLLGRSHHSSTPSRTGPRQTIENGSVKTNKDINKIFRMNLTVEVFQSKKTICTSAEAATTVPIGIEDERSIEISEEKRQSKLLSPKIHHLG